MRRTFIAPRVSILGMAILTVGTLAASAQTEDDRNEVFEQTIAPFLKEHCLDCHGEQTAEARLRFDQISGFQPSQSHLWTLVHEHLESGSMPPKDAPQPPLDAKRKVQAWIVGRQLAARGDGTRRLNRRELSAALQDVTGLAIDYGHLLPEDGKIDGFDTGANALQDAADSVAQLLVVTRQAVEGIRFLDEPAGKILHADFRDLKDPRKALDHWKADGAYVKPRGHARKDVGLLLEPKWLGDRPEFSFNVLPPDTGRGILRLKFEVAATKGEFAEIPNPHFWVEVGGTVIDRREITNSPDQPLELNYVVQIDDLAIETRGIAVTLHNKVEMPYSVKGFKNDEKAKPEEKIPGGTGLFRPAWDRKARLSPEKKPVPYVVVQSIEVETSYVSKWPPVEWNSQFEVTDSAASANHLLSIWMERAWRRPITDSEKQRFLALYVKVRKKGASFDDALRAAFQSVLMSSPFRYLHHAAGSDEVVSNIALASRLSFMLVGAPPDSELRRLAQNGTLNKHSILESQVDRLLDDPRSEAFVRPFVWQWLKLGQPITLAMDHIKKQDFRFGRFLKESMQDESVAYVAKLVEQNRPASELIRSDWTMMNNSLARHYGYEGIVGSRLRKVPLRKNDPRGGGLLGQAGIQSMLCWMGDNWVIYRGAWTLRHILDAPPPPPPLEVPELNPSEGGNRGKTFKELLAQHQEDERCSICHRTMDPLGFAFQNFDLSGRWRDVEYEKYERAELDGKIQWRGAGKTRPVDAVGKLPRGEEFRSFAECKDIIVRHYQDDLVRGLLKNLFLYGTGRKADVEDLTEIRSIMKKLKPTDYRMRDLIKSVVLSKAFHGE